MKTFIRSTKRMRRVLFSFIQSELLCCTNGSQWVQVRVCTEVTSDTASNGRLIGFPGSY